MKYDNLDLVQRKHTFIKINSLLRFSWLFLLLTFIYNTHCLNKLCEDNVLSSLVLSIIPGFIYLYFALTSINIIYKVKHHNNKFGTSKLKKLKLASLISIIIIILLAIINLSINPYMLVMAIILEIINFFKIRKYLQEDTKVEETLIQGKMTRYIYKKLKEEQEKNKE